MEELSVVKDYIGELMEEAAEYFYCGVYSKSIKHCDEVIRLDPKYAASACFPMQKTLNKSWNNFVYVRHPCWKLGGAVYTIFDSSPGATGKKDCMVTVCVDATAASNAQLSINGFNVGEEIPIGMCRTWYGQNIQKVRVSGVGPALSKGTYTISII